MWDNPKWMVTNAIFEILRNGHDVPNLRDSAYLEVYNRANNIFMFWRIERLARTWLNADARYIGLLLLADLVEHADRRRTMRRARRALKSLRKSEKHPRNLEVIENALDATPATGVPKRLSAKFIGSCAAKAAEA